MDALSQKLGPTSPALYTEPTQMSVSLQPLQRHAVKVRGGDLSVYQYGEAGLTPLLAIHGITSSHLIWQYFARCAVAAGYTVYAPDLRGRASSNHLPGLYGMSSHAEDMRNVLMQLQLDDTLVVGHSMGAFVAVALQELWGESIAGMALIDGGVPLEVPEGIPVDQLLGLILGSVLARLKMTFPSRRAYRDYWATLPAFAQGLTEEMQRYLDHDLTGQEPELVLSTSERAVVEDSTDLLQSDLIPRALKNLTSSVIFCRAVEGLQHRSPPLYSERAVADMGLQYPWVEVTTIPDTNHYSILMSQLGAAGVAKTLGFTGY